MQTQREFEKNFKQILNWAEETGVMQVERPSDDFLRGIKHYRQQTRLWRRIVFGRLMYYPKHLLWKLRLELRILKSK